MLFSIILGICWGCKSLNEPEVGAIDQPNPVVKIFVTPDGEVKYATVVKVQWDVQNADDIKLNFSPSKASSGTIIDTIRYPKTYVATGIKKGKAFSDSVKVVVKEERRIGGYLNGGLIGSFTDSTKQHGTIFRWAPRMNWYNAMANGNLLTIDQLKFIYGNKDLFKDLLVPPSYWDQAYWSKSLPIDYNLNPDFWGNWMQILDFFVGPKNQYVGLKGDVCNVLYVEIF